MKVLLIETAAADRPGSMHRYAELIEQALIDEPACSVSRVNLAPTARELSRSPQRLRTAWHHATVLRRAMSVVRKQRADIYHLIDGSHGYVTRWLPRGRSVVTVHDVIPYLQSQRRFPVPPPSRGAQWLIHTSLRSLRSAASIMADSTATERDVAAIDPTLRDRLCVAPLAVPPVMMPLSGTLLPDWEARRRNVRPYLLHVGNNGFYKNRAGAIRIFDRIRETVPCRLVMAGPPPDRSLTELIRNSSLTDLVEFVVDPTDSTICELYREARLLLFPSYYEGFGWPPLEAMAWGCPVVSSHNGSLAEVVGDAGLTADVDDELALTRHAINILTDPICVERLVAAGHARVQDYSLATFREKLLEVYRSLATK
ncbi:MAG TPA: glycosyltransferase family 1 protein [Planctomycetaceae bacterium]|nr:glycosyltransferase family 1 protein [Planctomycetaceae bacterium]